MHNLFPVGKSLLRGPSFNVCQSRSPLGAHVLQGVRAICARVRQGIHVLHGDIVVFVCHGELLGCLSVMGGD